MKAEKIRKPKPDRYVWGNVRTQYQAIEIRDRLLKDHPKCNAHIDQFSDGTWAIYYKPVTREV